MSLTSVVNVAGPFYEDLRVGQRFDFSPGLTLTVGHQVLHQAILGDRLRLPLDAHLCREVAGDGPPLAHPGLVCDVAIGQSTLATQRVIGNLFYRGLALRRWPRIGDTLRTVSEVVALRDNASRDGRAPTGLAVLRVRTADQEERPVLDFHRCAMLPMRSEERRPGCTDNLDAIAEHLTPDRLLESLGAVDLGAFRRSVRGRHGDHVEKGQRYIIETGDTVTSATELVRLSLNVAGAHSDPDASRRGRRLVYGGHTIGIAGSQLTRALPNLVTIAGWRSCDHLAPVFEGDVLHSEVSVEQVHSVPAHAAVLVDLRVQTDAVGELGDREPVLDWRLVGVMA